ncbi:hypothetical protein [Flexibacterium corallicola]|uniref:hypothetical protein n=1 Tax=Flexibacterium corallicola TaxID=3037259 RepID=UPI00286EBC39|nr:hypothetical protein [Pseudovibrio sp. M1P-2-3]
MDTATAKYIRHDERSIGQRGKVSKPLRTFLEHNPVGTIRVLIVLDTPQPDMSYLLAGGQQGSFCADNTEDALCKAIDEVGSILKTSGHGDFKTFARTASILAEVDSQTINALEASSRVQEIVANERLN